MRKTARTPKRGIRDKQEISAGYKALRNPFFKQVNHFLKRALNQFLKCLNQYLKGMNRHLQRPKHLVMPERKTQTTRQKLSIFLVTPAKALGLGPQTHAFLARDAGFRRHDKKALYSVHFNDENQSIPLFMGRNLVPLPGGWPHTFLKIIPSMRPDRKGFCPLMVDEGLTAFSA